MPDSIKRTALLSGLCGKIEREKMILLVAWFYPRGWTHTLLVHLCVILQI